MAFDATVGGPNANSLVSLAVIAAYFESSLNKSVYDNWDQPRIELLAMVATKQINWYFEWIGVPATTSQAQPWPRKRYDFDFDFDSETYADTHTYNGYQLDKNPLDGTTIPQLLIDAICELMIVLDVGPVDIGYSSIEELKVGPINIVFGGNVQTGGFSKQVIEMLKRIGTYNVSQPGGLTMIKLER